MNISNMGLEISENVNLSELGDTTASVAFTITMGNKTYHAAIEGTEMFRELTPFVDFSNSPYWGKKMVIWFHHPDGRLVYNSYQGGVNENGLALSLHEVPALPMNAYPEFDDPLGMDYIPMNECSTVDEVIDYYSAINFIIWGDCMPRQMHFTDKSGDAVVISAGDDGNPVFTRIENHFLVSTNFNLANPENRYGDYPCERYDTCVEMLSDIQTEEELNLDAVRDILQEACVPEYSLYSYIYDPNEMMVYFFFPYDFSQVVPFDFNNETAEYESESSYNITKLFENFTIPTPVSPSTPQTQTSSSTTQTPKSTTPTSTQEPLPLFEIGIISVVGIGGVSLLVIALWKMRYSRRMNK